MITTIISNVTGNGSKYIATNLAYILNKQHPDKKILLIDFDKENPTLGQSFYLNKKNNSFNIIMQNLTDLKIDMDILKNNIYEYKNGLDVLMGMNLDEIDLTNHITDEMYDKFFELINNLYDEIIVVISKNMDEKLNYFTLKYTSRTIITLRNNNSNEVNINNTLKLIKAYTNSKIYYITNMYEKKFKTYYECLSDCKSLGTLIYDKTQIDNHNLIKNKVSKMNFNYRTFTKIIKTLYPNKKGV